MADDEKKPKRRSGCIARLGALVVMLAVAGLGVAVYFAAMPQDLSDLRVDDDGPAARPRNIRTVLENSLDRGFAVTLTEDELNAWLARTVEAKQGGLLEGHVTLEGVRVRLEEGWAEVILERRIFGRPQTVSMFVRIEQLETSGGRSIRLLLDGGPYHEAVPFPPRGGRFGRLTVPQGFLLLVQSSFSDLAELFREDEIHLAFERMARIQFNDGSVTFHPLEPMDGAGLPGSF